MCVCRSNIHATIWESYSRKACPHPAASCQHAVSLVLLRARRDHEPPAVFPDGPAVRNNAVAPYLVSRVHDNHVLRANGWMHRGGARWGCKRDRNWNVWAHAEETRKKRSNLFRSKYIGGRHARRAFRRLRRSGCSARRIARWRKAWSRQHRTAGLLNAKRWARRWFFRLLHGCCSTQH